MTNLNSKIEWTDCTWNVVTGCTKVSDGCTRCYAETITERFHGKGSFATVKLHADRLDAPLRWRKPRQVFVNSMSDLFHQDVPDEFIARVFAVMAATPRHQFQILTKRHGRMKSLLNRPSFPAAVSRHFERLVNRAGREQAPRPEDAWPLPNLWLGVSVEDQDRADLRIPALLDTPAAVRFLSCEPLLGPVDLRAIGAIPELLSPFPKHRGIDWCIVGGESGSGARVMQEDWAAQLVTQCRCAGVPCFVKQMGSVWARQHGWAGKGGLPEQWPADLRIREFPAVAS